ncbi:MAG: hypothetical protein BGO31_07660 [Bacteroidetes bacterium 43-16]|nr:MAG: hypothetical protein BGO31_07660 [Bacteroidetes bacterium 43-16]
MKKVRVITSAAMLGLLSIGTMTFMSCTKDCEVGYEGSNCKTLSREKFIGDWEGTDQCSSGSYDIDIAVSTSSVDEVTVNIANLGGFGGTVSVKGVMTGTNSLSIASQSVGGGRTLSGNMNVSGNQLTLQYTVQGTNGSDVCNGAYTKK